MIYSKQVIYKKGVILLITLFFIMAITAIIVKNLQDTEEFIDEVAVNSSLSQLNITINNVNSEIMRVVKKINDEGNLEDILSSLETIPLNYGNVKVLINLEEYTNDGKYNLYDANASFIYKLDRFSDDQMFTQNVIDKYTLENMFMKQKPTNKRQIDFVIDNYIKETRDDVIVNVKENFVYHTMDTNSTYINCKYKIDINNIKSDVNMIFAIGGKVVDMDVTFK
jgi:hypothetical protein